jgi:hypothetical protein
LGFGDILGHVGTNKQREKISSCGTISTAAVHYFLPVTQQSLPNAPHGGLGALYNFFDPRIGLCEE